MMNKHEDQKKKEWVAQFVCQFLASYAASIFDDACTRSAHSRFDNLPVEDADFIAGKAWEQYNTGMRSDPI